MTCKLERQHHVLDRRHLRQQLEGLEDEAEVLGTPPGASILVPGEKIILVHGQPAAARQIQARQQAEQGRLAGAGRPGDGNRLALLDRERHRIEDGQVLAGVWYAFA
jgi:hypothetical protein